MAVMGVIDDLPYGRLKRALDAVRRRFYTVDVPSEDGFVAPEMSPTDVEKLLRSHEHFEGTQAAYYYRGEVANLRRPAGAGHGGRFMELHVRLFHTADGGTFLQTHYEASRYEEPEAHIEERRLSWYRGRTRLKETLEEHDITHDKRSPTVL